MEIQETTTSTMDIARTRVREGSVVFDQLGRPSVPGVLAYEQTAGRGQLGRAWYSKPGESLCVTLYVRHQIVFPQHAGYLSLSAGVAVAEVLDRLPLSGRTLLKWPNDIILHDRKLGGILVETVRAADGKPAALVGIGLNLRIERFPEDIGSHSISLVTALPDKFPIPAPETLAQEITERLGLLVQQEADEARPTVLARWRERDTTRGRRYEAEWNGKRVSGSAVGISPSGGLLVALDAEHTIEVASASSIRELSTIPAPGPTVG